MGVIIVYLQRDHKTIILAIPTPRVDFVLSLIGFKRVTFRQCLSEDSKGHPRTILFFVPRIRAVQKLIQTVKP